MRILQLTIGGAAGMRLSSVFDAATLAPEWARLSREPRRDPRILCRGSVKAESLWTMLRRDEASCLPDLAELPVASSEDEDFLLLAPLLYFFSFSEALRFPPLPPKAGR